MLAYVTTAVWHDITMDDKMFVYVFCIAI